MRDFKDDHQTIRQFLLGQLSDDEAKGLEERIFGEADFAEEVQIVENELLTEYSEGNLIAEERTLLETKYSNNEAGRITLEYEKLFNEFIRARSEGNLSPRPIESQSIDSPLTNTEIPASQVSLKLTPESPGPPLHSIFGTHRILAYSAILIGAALSITLIWYLIGHRIGQPGTTLKAQRQAIEADLARLNTGGAARTAKVLSAVNLQPAERYGGVMARVRADQTTPDGMIEFRLNLMKSSTQEYRALFRDDRQNELFSISNLKPQNTPSDPEIRLLVPTRYLNPGDYQINLTVANRNGDNDEINSYSFRVVTSQ